MNTSNYPYLAWNKQFGIMMSIHNDLLTEFEGSSSEEWKQKIIKDLKGKPIESLSWPLDEEILMEPFYTLEDRKEVSIPSRPLERLDWEIAEDIIVNRDLKKANKDLLDGLVGGVNAPRLHINHDLDENDLGVLFKEVETDFISLHLVLSEQVNPSMFIESFSAYLKERKKEWKDLRGSIMGCEFQEGVRMKSIAVDSHGFYRGIEQIPEELSKTIGLGVDLIMASADGRQATGIFESIFFSVRIGKSYFPMIAKLRALRVLWQRIAKGFEEETTTPEIEVVFSDDAYGENPNTNLIRATTMSMSAVLGGADRLVVTAPDFEGKQGYGFSRRITRNIQHLLKMESFFDKVHDPLAGSYYVEKLTEVFVEKAWADFLKREEKYHF